MCEWVFAYIIFGLGFYTKSGKSMYMQYPEIGVRVGGVFFVKFFHQARIYWFLAGMCPIFYTWKELLSPLLDSVAVWFVFVFSLCIGVFSLYFYVHTFSTHATKPKGLSTHLISYCHWKHCTFHKSADGVFVCLFIWHCRANKSFIISFKMLRLPLLLVHSSSIANH